MGQHARTQQMVDALVASLGPGPWPRNDVVAQGWSRHQIDGAVRAGRLIRPHNGVLALPSARRAVEGTPDHRTAVVAALQTAPPTAAVSHESGGDLHGLWQPEERDPLVQLTVPGDQDEVRHGVRIHGSALPSNLVVEVDGIPVTSLARTAVDIARGHRLPDALMVLDSAARLMSHPHPTEETYRDPEVRARAARRARALLKEAYDSVWAWPGSRVVKTALPLVDPGSESPFESWSRGWMVVAGLTLPKIAAPVTGASGTEWWVDFRWDKAKVIGEADGLGKYGGSDAEVRERLAAERRRQRDLEAAGWRFERWTFRDRPLAWISRVRQLHAEPR
jgi:hypothetical protein